MVDLVAWIFPNRSYLAPGFVSTFAGTPGGPHWKRIMKRAMKKESIEEKIEHLHSAGVVDMHFDLPLGLQWKGRDPGVITKEFLPDFEAGNIGVLGVATYVEDDYLDKAANVALGQIARLYAGVAASDAFAICKTWKEIQRARENDRIALLAHDGRRRTARHRSGSPAHFL